MLDVTFYLTTKAVLFCYQFIGNEHRLYHKTEETKRIRVAISI